MRYAWISILVVLLDQLSKWLIPYFDLGDAEPLTLGRFFLQFTVPAIGHITDIRTSLSNNTALILLAALLSTHLLISRWSGQFHFITTRTAVGLQLAGGGLTAQAIDLVFRGETANTFRITYLQHFAFQAGIAELAMLAGFLLLLITLVRGNTKLQSRVTLAPANLAPLHLNLLPRGIDNIHIDVHLSPRFCGHATRLIHNLVPVIIKQLQQGKHQFSLPAKQAGDIRNDFNELMGLALHKAKGGGEKQLPDLLFISVLKFIHAEVNNTVAGIVQKNKEGKREHNLRGLKATSNSDMVQWLFRYRDHIAALVNRAIFDAICHKQSARIQKSIRNFLGLKTLFSLQAMESPLLLADSPSSEPILIDNYLILGQQQNDRNSFVNIDRELDEIFSEYLDLVEISDSEPERKNRTLQDAGDINSNTIDTLSQPSVLMNPANIPVLLDADWTERRLKKTRALQNWRKYRKLRQHLAFQRRLREKVKIVLQKSGLATWIVATYKAKEILTKAHSDIHSAQLTSILARKMPKQEFAQKLSESLRGLRKPPAREQIIQNWEQIQKDREKLLEHYLLKFVHDFSHYRRDLLRLFIYQRAAADINLLESEKDIETSRANYSLYEFLHRSEAQSANAEILSHIIIKADLRGSTEVTEKLTELELNPATHFDRNFFSPINEVIEAYGAEKVFIEGDAIILILNEHAGENQDRLLAARACGLAAKILQIIAKQNRELVAYSLPGLELGIGIAYHQGPPRYLFDGQHRITISPAINRADRLSASTWSIRNWHREHNIPNHFVEVYHPSENARSQGEKAQKAMVFNLNGILMENGVFDRLNKELTLKKVNNTLADIAESKLYAIQFPDLSGNNHSLIIRKAPVHTYDPDYSAKDCPEIHDQFFYEVIWREELQQKLRKR